MTSPEIQGPHIKFCFEGIVALCVKEGGNYFDAGIIKGVGDNEEITDHQHSITVTKKVEGKEDEILLVINQQYPARLLRIALSKQTQSGPGIVFFKKTGGTGAADKEDDKLDYGLVLDVEKRIYDGKKVEINKKALRSVLRVTGIEKGTFYTKKKARNPIITTKGDVGVVAYSVEALISLPESGSSLEIFNEKSKDYEQAVEFEHQNGVTYEIAIKNVCRVERCNQSSVDQIYNDFIKGPKGENQILFANPPQSNAQDSTAESGCPVIVVSSDGNLPDPDPPTN